MGHYTDKCPTLSSEPEDVNAMGGYQGQLRPMGFQNTYNSNWRNNPNNPYPPKQNPPNVMMRPQFSQYPSQQPLYPQTSHHPPNYQQPQLQGQSSGNHQMGLQELTKNTFSDIQAQVGDLVTTLNKIEQRGKLPSQTEKNLNVRAIILKSVKTLGESIPKRVSREVEDEFIVVEPTNVVVPPKEPVVTNIDQLEFFNNGIKPLVIPPPFPSRLAISKKKEEENEFFETFHKVQINIPLLNAIKKIPSYENFLKDLCTKKRKFKANEKIKVYANLYAVIQKKLPPKCKDPRIFVIPCTIGDLHVESVMLDLGASINVMPY
ncbi:uncharacterized protein LOC111905425 [Lactuca sativa]|uniref:uncharacterized protein LOC111905425 n=1 Tax=Lactuca sativa TaxID=4236 RepID=UPI000CD8CF4D|nr:uncharacterized protein LOC111905425 [Lactuca sativa]